MEPTNRGPRSGFVQPKSSWHLPSRPGVRGQDLLQGWMRHQLMAFHRAGDALGDLVEVDPAVAKRGDGRLVRRVKDRGQRPACFAGAPRQLEGRKAFVVGLLEGEAAE